MSMPIFLTLMAYFTDGFCRRFIIKKSLRKSKILTGAIITIKATKVKHLVSMHSLCPEASWLLFKKQNKTEHLLVSQGF